MNWTKINQLYGCGCRVVNFIGVRNIAFFGLLGTSIGASYVLDESERPYYQYKFFKRVQPTQTVYEHPY